MCYTDKDVNYPILYRDSGMEFNMYIQESQLMQLLERSVSAYHTVEETEKRLQKAGFQELSGEGSWELHPNGAYYLKSGGTTLFAFVIGQHWSGAKKLRVGAAHTDYPGFSIKNNPDISACGYQKLNVEVYGGPILNTWLDRPLSAAGQVVLRSDDVWHPHVRLVDLKKPFCIIPNLAIHMNREVNKGVALNRQTELLPVAGLAGEDVDKEAFLTYLAKEIQVDKEDILDFDLHLYSPEKPQIIGMEEDMISACHLDNTTSVQALLDGILDAARQVNKQTVEDGSANGKLPGRYSANKSVDEIDSDDGEQNAELIEQSDNLKGIRLMALFDHEEIGSRTKQGAGSMLLYHVLQKIGSSATLQGAAFFDHKMSVEELCQDAMLLSVDVAHGIHPNYAGKMDLTNQPVLGKGFCIKEACSQSYATDSFAIGILQQLCDSHHIGWQKFVNRSDQPGGSTLGSIASSFLPVPTVDIGVPLLSMHSVRELMGRADMEALSACISAFYRQS